MRKWNNLTEWHDYLFVKLCWYRLTRDKLPDDRKEMILLQCTANSWNYSRKRQFWCCNLFIYVVISFSSWFIHLCHFRRNLSFSFHAFLVLKRNLYSVQLLIMYRICIVLWKFLFLFVWCVVTMCSRINAVHLQQFIPKYAYKYLILESVNKLKISN